MPTLLGTHLGPYEIVARLGAGGMGDVYRARDRRLARDVAIKVLPAEMATNPEALARFEREARAVAALNHPNILALHDVNRDGEVAYVVTELLEGTTLRDKLSSGPLPPHRAQEILVEFARGLAAAHDRGIVHRDIKPANLFITKDGRAKILDFGVALRETAADKAGDLSTLVTEPGTLMGTPGYMSPEQLRGEPATARSDLFALGVVARELLTGVHPFRRSTSAETIGAILSSEPESLERLVPSLPQGVARLLDRCLDKDASRRPASARDLALYLELLGAPPNPYATATAPAEQTTPGGLRRRFLAVWSALLILVVLLMWAYVRVMADRAVAGAIEADLGRAERLVARVHNEHLRGLMLTARLLASIPELKALFVGTDAATIRDFLLGYQSRYPGAPILVALDTRGRVLARTDAAAALEAEAPEPWLAAVADRPGEPSVVEVGGRPFHAAAAAAEAGGTVFGYVIAAMPVGESFAQELRDATQDEVVVLSENGLLVSTLRDTRIPWTSLKEWRQQGGRVDRVNDVRLGVRRFAAREVRLVEDPPLSVIVAKSRDEAVAPFRQIQMGLLAVGLLCAGACLAALYWMVGKPPTLS
jgi:Protein kinase domain